MCTCSFPILAQFQSQAFVIMLIAESPDEAFAKTELASAQRDFPEAIAKHQCSTRVQTIATEMPTIACTTPTQALLFVSANRDSLAKLVTLTQVV